MNKRLKFVVGAAAAGLLLYYPATTGFALLQEATDTSASTAAQARAMAAAATAAEQADPAKVSAELGALKAAIPATPQLETLLEQVQSAADASGVQWVSATPGQAGSTGNALVEYPLSATVSGSASGIQKWLDKVAHLTRLVTVDSVVMQDSDGEYSATIAARFYTDPAGQSSAPAVQQ